MAPRKYSERRVNELTGKDGAPVEVKDSSSQKLDASVLDEDERAALRALKAQAATSSARLSLPVIHRCQGRFSARGIDLTLGWQSGTPARQKRSCESDFDPGAAVVRCFATRLPASVRQMASKRLVSVAIGSTLTGIGHS